MKIDRKIRNVAVKPWMLSPILMLAMILMPTFACIESARNSNHCCNDTNISGFEKSRQYFEHPDL